MRICLDNCDAGTVTTHYTRLISQDHVNFTFGPLSSLLTAPAQVAARNHYAFPRARAVRRRFDLMPSSLLAVSTPVAGQLVPFANRVGSQPAS
jgi:hypothetical protein